MKVGIVGIKGRVAKRHLQAWQELGIEPTGFDIGDEYNLQDYDLIDICAPIFLHVRFIKEAVKAGIPVICEKPLARTLAEAQEIIGLDHKIGIIHQFRFNPKMIKLKKEIESGKYGEIRLVTSNYYRYRSEDYYGSWEGNKDLAGGGAVLNVTIHYLDLMQWIFGEPLEIYGFSNTSKDIEVEDSAVAIMRFSNNVIGSYVVTTHCQPQKHYEFTVVGTKGSKTIQLRQNEYHKENLQAFLDDGDYMRPEEALKSLRMALEIIK